MNDAKRRKMTKVSVERQTGSAVLLAATSIILLGTGLVIAQLNATKASIASASVYETSTTGPSQAAALAAAAGIAFVQGLSPTTNTFCSRSTGCSSGVYGASVLTGGARNQPASWWTTSNARTGPAYGGLRSKPLYVVEYLSCDSDGNARYRVTGRATSNSSETTSSVANQSGGAFASRTVIKAFGVKPDTTGIFINQLSSDAFNSVRQGPTLGYNATSTLNEKATGSNIGFTAGNSGYITTFDMKFFLIGNDAGPTNQIKVNSDCSTHIFEIALSNQNGRVQNYSTTLNQAFWTRPTDYNCSPKYPSPSWYENTYYGFPLTPPFEVKSGDRVTVKVSSVNYAGQVKTLAKDQGSDTIKVKLIGIKKGLPNCPSAISLTPNIPISVKPDPTGL